MTFNLLDYALRLSAEPPAEESAWQEHIPFAGVLIEMLRPRILVELGVHHGGSYLAFCKAIEDLALDCACYGFDAFVGDEHAGGYGSDVETHLRERHDARYGRFSRIVRSSFDEARNHFADGSIDLLHIDGLHSYEAARHDFEHWLPKMSASGVVLFHDINVRERGFGVWRVWDEVKRDRAHFTFEHGNGLGVLAVGDEHSPALRSFLALDGEEARRVRECFFALGQRISLQVERSSLRDRLVAQYGLVAQRDDEVRRLRQQLATVQEMQLEQEVTLAELGKSLHEANSFIHRTLQSVSFRLGVGATAPLRWVASRITGKA
jgi:hypothetical protein